MGSRKPLSKGPPRGRREHRKHLTRRELLAAGRKLFAEKGLYDSRIEDLSRQAGIAKGTLYGYFANKEELIEAVVTSGFSELLGHVHRAVQGASSREDAIASAAEAHLTFFEENPDLMRVFHQVRGLLKFKRVESLALREVLVHYLTGLAQVLAIHPPSRAQREAQGVEVAMLLFGAISGVASVRASVNGEVPGGIGPRPIVRAVVGLVRGFEASARGTARRAGARAAAERTGRPPRGRRSRMPRRARSPEPRGDDRARR